MNKYFTFILSCSLISGILQPSFGQCRTAVIDNYNTNYLGSATSEATMAWTGVVSTCTPGTISATAISKVFQRLNYYRKLVGLNDNITSNATMNGKSQESSLMMMRNQSLNHTPPNNWACFTANGYEAASKGNLAAGTYGASDIDAWMSDNGTPSAGHRRWVLSPNASEFGYGSIKDQSWFTYAGTLMVMGGATIPYVTPASGYIQFPVSGYMPKNLIPTLWSFGTVGDIGNFSSTSISVTDDNGNTVPITINALQPGYGNSSTITWNMPAVNQSDPIDRVYTVTISNFSVNGAAQNPYTYKVVAIQPQYADVAVTSTGSACNNGTASASFTPGYKSILWSTGATTASISGLAAGNYTVSVTDKNNCVVTKAVNIPAVNAGAAPTPVITASGSTSICGGGSPTSLQVTGSPLYASFQWMKDGAAVAGATAISYSPTTSGSYSLKITSCQGTSLTSNAVPFFFYNSATIPVACTFTSNFAGSSAFGIENFTFNTINNTSGTAGAEGVYVNNTCSQSTMVNPGQAYSFSLKAAGNTQSAKIYIDYNNNGTFETAEQVYGGSYAISHTGTIAIPSTATQNVPLRMRVIADFSDLSTITSCHINGYAPFTGSGQAEDYSLIIYKASNPLPVTLISFQGKASQEGNKLTWITTSETNNDYFEIQRSSDSYAFENIGKINGQNTTVERQEYNWTDPYISNNVTFYRLKQVDFDGSSAFSRIISVKPTATEKNFVMGPNPFADHITIQSDVSDAFLYDLSGRMLQKLSKGFNNLSAYSSGLYIIRYGEAGATKYYSIVKQ